MALNTQAIDEHIKAAELEMEALESGEHVGDDRQEAWKEAMMHLALALAACEAAQARKPQQQLLKGLLIEKAKSMIKTLKEVTL
jgi:hypothetical protein